MGVYLDDFIIPNDQPNDELVWSKSLSGVLTVKEAYEVHKKKGRKHQWQKNIWKRYIPPKVLCFVWKIVHDRLTTEVNALNRGVEIPGACYVCDNQLVLEDQEHLLSHCEYVIAIWSWVQSLINLDLRFLLSLHEKIRWVSALNLKQ